MPWYGGDASRRIRHLVLPRRGQGHPVGTALADAELKELLRLSRRQRLVSVRMSGPRDGRRSG